MVQGPTCLANVGAGAFSTWDAVHHTFPAIGWYRVLWVHKLLPQGPVGTECNLDGKGGHDPTDGLGQSTDVGESHRSTDQVARGPRDQVARGSVTLPYISGLSESIRRVMAPLAIQVTFRPYRTLRQELVHPKDPVPANRRCKQGGNSGRRERLK